MSDPPPSLVLASASPRRAAILRRLGLEFEVRPAGLDEERRPGEPPEGRAVRLARRKAIAVSRARPDALVVGADTVVALGEELLEKPRDEAEAVRMLLGLSGRTHTVLTGIALASPDGTVDTGISRTRVTFRAVDEDHIRAYAATGEPLDKAGGYGIQARGAALVSRIEGDYYAVVGLPVTLLLDLLEAAGWRYRFGWLEPTGPDETS